MKKIFAYIGSGAGENSHTYIYTKKILDETLKKSNSQIQFDIYTPANTTINGCKSCNSCFEKGICPLDNSDDMKMLKQKIISADFIIFGTPIYAHNISSDMKRFIDRISYFMHILILSDKYAIALSTTSNNGYTIGIDYLQKTFRFLGAKMVAKDNVSLHYPPEFSNKKIIAKKVDLYSNLIIKCLNDSSMLRSDIEINKIFFSLKDRIKSYELFPNFEYNYWKENGLFECETFDEVIIKNKYIVEKYLNNGFLIN